MDYNPKCTLFPQKHQHWIIMLNCPFKNQIAAFFLCLLQPEKASMHTHRHTHTGSLNFSHPRILHAQQSWHGQEKQPMSVEYYPTGPVSVIDPYQVPQTMHQCFRGSDFIFHDTVWHMLRNCTYFNTLSSQGQKKLRHILAKDLCPLVNSDRGLILKVTLHSLNKNQSPCGPIYELQISEKNNTKCHRDWTAGHKLRLISYLVSETGGQRQTRQRRQKSKRAKCFPVSHERIINNGNKWAAGQQWVMKSYQQSIIMKSIKRILSTGKMFCLHSPHYSSDVIPESMTQTTCLMTKKYSPQSVHSGIIDKG